MGKRLASFRFAKPRREVVREALLNTAFCLLFLGIGLTAFSELPRAEEWYVSWLVFLQRWGWPM